AFSTTSSSRHDLRRDNGRHGPMITRSPSLEAPFSSCARSLVVRRMYLPYVGCLMRRSISTAIVFCILSLTTRPVRVRAPFSSAAVSAGAAAVAAAVSVCAWVSLGAALLADAFALGLDALLRAPAFFFALLTSAYLRHWMAASRAARSSGAR